MRTILVIILLTASAFAQSRNNPKIAYVYPAGGEGGTTVDVMVAGRQIARAGRVFVSGEGVSGTVLSGYSNVRVNDADERAAIRRFFAEARLRFILGDEFVPEMVPPLPPPANTDEERPVITREQMMRKYPFLDVLENPTHLGLQRLFYEYYHVRPDRMAKETMANCVFARLTIANQAQPGTRELRLMTPSGLSTPIRFVVGTTPEVTEIEPNDTASPNPAEWMPSAFSNESIQRQQGLTAQQKEELVRRVRVSGQNMLSLEVLTLPVVINGQIRSGDVDRFSFQAEKGQKLVIAMQARHLIPYLADAVPGWFQGMLTLYGLDGRELVNASSYRFEPDPLIRFEVPETGIYSLEVRDTIFRGRDDFVYRISLGETPLVTALFPLGAQEGTQTDAELQGWHLPANTVRFDTSPSDSSLREIRELNGQPLPRPIRYAVDNLPELTLQESAALPMAVTLPVIINGRILTATGVDSFQFTGQKDETIVCDVSARSLDSILDATLELLSPDGTLLAKNDDRADSKGPNIGLETHHADPYLRETLPADGTYTVRIYNTPQRGGSEYTYRLRLSPPQPGFTVYCTPSTLTLQGGQPVTFHAVRRDGFEGNITISIPDNTPFRLSNAVIPAGSDTCKATLTGTNRFDGNLQSLTFTATGKTDDKELTTAVIACDDHEQAFIYHHLVPTSGLMVIRNGR